MNLALKRSKGPATDTLYGHINPLLKIGDAPMDVIYFWKTHAADMKAGRIGRFKSTPVKLTALADGYPDFLWVFKTPEGRKGEVQLLARLRWVDKSTTKIKAEPGQVYMHYDPLSEQSITYVDSDDAAAVARTSKWVANYFPKMLSGSFQSVAGQEGLRGAALTELQMLASGFAAEPFMRPEHA